MDPLPTTQRPTFPLVAAGVGTLLCPYVYTRRSQTCYILIQRVLLFFTSGENCGFDIEK